METSEGKLLLMEEEWKRRENAEGQLLLTRDEWLKKAEKEWIRGSGDIRERRDWSKVKCFSCGAYGHYAAECRKPRRDKKQRTEAHLT